MKWPAVTTLARHIESEYNILKDRKKVDPEYQRFVKAFESNPRSKTTQRLAETMRKKYALGVGDCDTSGTDGGYQQGVATGKRLHQIMEVPDVVICSPYKRTRQTFDAFKEGWPALRRVTSFADDRIREQEHGLGVVYGDWRIMFAMHPEQKLLFDLEGPYWYQNPQGESVSQVRARGRDFTNMLIREWRGKKVFMITHHLTILSFRANWERLAPEEFIHLDRHDRPANSSVTQYVGEPARGKNGRLRLNFYNRKLY